jgi:putative transposase
MSNPYLSLYVHLIWSTYQRQPTLTEDIEESVYRYLHTQCESQRAVLLAIGGIETHIHLLVKLPSSLSVGGLVKQLKGSSSRFISYDLERPSFKWQGGYGAFTMQRSLVPRVQDYIHHQKEHHRANTLKAILEKDEEEAGEEREEPLEAVE